MHLRVLFSLILVALARTDPRQDHFKSMVNEVNANSQKAGWTARLHPEFDYSAQANLTAMTGALYDPTNPRFHYYRAPGPKPDAQTKRRLQSLPASFDLRQKYTSCLTWFVKNQGFCASCWAIASMGTLSDRVCIQSVQKGQRPISKEFSFQDLLECCPDSICKTKGDGCQGAFISGAYSYVKRFGVVTGGNYNSTTTCKPYFLTGREMTPQKAPVCTRSCWSGFIFPRTYQQDLSYIADWKQIFDPDLGKTVLLVMDALMNRGSVLTFMYAYEDFYTYSSGVYSHVTGGPIGGHVVRIVGWGTENGIDYWLCINSWGTDWGIYGTFKIKRGANESLIEAFLLEPVLAG